MLTQCNICSSSSPRSFAGGATSLSLLLPRVVSFHGHPLLLSPTLCCSRSSTLSTSLLTLSLRLTFGFLLLLLPASSAFLLSLSISLHSCSAYVLLVAVCSTLLLSSGVSSFRSLSSHNPPPIFLLSSHFYIFSESSFSLLPGPSLFDTLTAAKRLGWHCVRTKEQH